MQRLSREQKSPRLAALIRFVWLIVVVAGIVWLAGERGMSIRDKGDKGFKGSKDSRGNSLPSLLLINDSFVTLLTSTGTQRLSREAFERLPTSNSFRLPIEGANAANGSLVWYRKEFRSPDSLLLARLGAPKSDGASVLEIQHAAEEKRSMSIILRRESIPLREARVHGWADAKTVFVSALRGSSRAIFLVEVNGTIRELAVLPDSVLSIEVRRGAMWTVTAQEGEGIESEPLPPSELHRVTLGGDQLVRREEKRLILNAVPGPKNEIAMTMNDGEAEYQLLDEHGRSAGLPVRLGKRRPLLFLEDRRLLLREGFELILLNPATGDTTRLETLPEGNVEVYAFPGTP